MSKIIFVCHGNICRSPMAECIFSDIVKKNHKEKDYYISSAAVSYEEEGNGIYPPAKRTLVCHNIPLINHRARRIEKDDYDNYDYIIAMDKSNLYYLKNILGEDKKKKIHLLTEYSSKKEDISDPWYTGDFETAYCDIAQGCNGLYSYLESLKEKNI